ncbi:MAG: flagellar basal body-associated FliL family protein [Methylococcaceae bacterium]|nr:flagellar basal body-associated FliL family protein [Methylococcaceae bacterium]
MKYPALRLILLFPLCFSVSAEDAGIENLFEYVSLEPSFVVNLQGNRRSYLRMDIQLLVDGKERADQIKAHMPALRHALILLISDYSAEQLGTSEQREKFRVKALNETRATLDKYASSRGLSDLFFTEFLVQ